MKNQKSRGTERQPSAAVPFLFSKFLDKQAFRQNLVLPSHFDNDMKDNKDILDKIELIRDECLSNPTRFRVLDLKSNLNQYFSYNYGWLFTLRMRFYSNEKKTLLFVA